MTRMTSLLLVAGLLMALAACGQPTTVTTSTAAAPATTPTNDSIALPVVVADEQAGGETAVPTLSSIPTYTYNIIASYPHDPGAFTQGLVYLDGQFYEGAGRYGESDIRRVDPESGHVLQIYELPPQYFGEGIAVWEDRLFQLTWQEGIGFIYDRDSFELLGQFNYTGEGWGLTHDGERLIMSDGTDTLRFLAPDTQTELSRIHVYDANGPVMQLNELEFVNGEILANIWKTNRIARIDPATGQVTGWIDLTGLLNPADITQAIDVLNGIAYDATTDRLFVTGKWWPTLFEIDLVLESE